VPLRTDLPEVEKERLDRALKVLANAASYGIYAEMKPKETDHNVEVVCHGIDAEPFHCRDLSKVPLAILVRESGMSRRMLIDTVAGRTRPHPKNQETLASIVRELDGI